MRRWVLAALPLFVTAANAGSKGLAVVEVSAPSSMEALALQMTTQILAAAEAQGLKVVPPDEVDLFLGAKNSLALKQCGPSPSCAAALLAEAPVDRVVVGTLARDETHYLVHLWLLSLSPPAKVSEVERAILIASRRLQSDVAATLPALLKGEQEATGTLVLESTVVGATVTLDGQPVGQTPVTRELKPGKHEIHVEHDGFYPVDRLVSVEAGQTTRDSVRLVALPGHSSP